MIDRAQQALHLQSLEPLVEEWADPNAYGFRQKRSTQDAMEQSFKVLSGRNSATWVLEGDIRKCFDTINHSWLENNILMDKTILRKFLKAGFMEHQQLYPTELGCPQGSPISPALTVMALSGLERKLLPAKRYLKEREKINVIAYADDFIVTAATKEVLKDRILPILHSALKEMGLELSKEKTKITNIEDGFDFLGFHFRKYNGKLLIKPSKANIKKFLKEIKLLIKKGIALPTEKLISALNSRLTGWVNYYKSSVAAKVFTKVDSEIFHALMKWCRNRHHNKGNPWLVKKYFTSFGGDNWRFYCKIKDKIGEQKLLYLKKASDTKIRRHIKIRSTANPFDPQYKEYFAAREKVKKQRSKIINDTNSAGLRINQSY
jgi:RNA-directed DNA polymerase